jgi:hypothetical protein
MVDQSITVPLKCWSCGSEFHEGYGCLSIVHIVCYKVEVRETGQSHVQRSHIECDVFLSVIRVYTYSA